ncbi:MAG: universal stress protein [Pseudomonadota bacterium]
MYKNILVPVDMAHTEKASDMIKAARKMADDDTVFVLANIIHSVPAVAEMAVPAEFFELAQTDAKDTLAKIAADEEIQAIVEIRTGHPANDILSIAEDKDIDLIIIGSHRPGLQDYLIGSTASRVVRHAQCPVLVMR